MTDKQASSRLKRVAFILCFVIGLIAVTAVGVIRLLRVRRLALTQAAQQQPYGKLSGEEIRDADEAAQRRKAAQYSDAELKRMVDRLFVKDDPGRANFDALLYAGTRPLPYLLKALDEPRTWTSVFPGNGPYSFSESPFSRICSLLRFLRPAAAVAPVARYLNHPSPEFRRNAAMLLASIGTKDCLEPVKKALADSDSQVREFTLIGLTTPGKGAAER